MENISHSRHPNRSKKLCGNAAAAAGTRTLYDDVYGGPPKFSAAAAAKTSLSPRMEDYSEIFGSFQASRASSIPVLDLPAVDESEVVFDVRGARFDYGEVFGRGYEGLGFAVSYEDLVNGDSSSEAWSPAEFESVSEESDGSSKDQNFSNGGRQYQVDGNTEFNISYNQAGQISSEDVSNGVTHVAQVHAVPGYSFMVDSASQPKERKMTADSYLDMDTSAEMMNTKKPEKVASVASNSSLGGSGFENEPRQKKGHEKDGSGTSFLDISKINLRTQPSDLPPPSRPPPVVGGKKGDLRKLVSKSNTSPFEVTPGDSSPTFFDVEVDASSSAAVSAAAIRDAMAKAQVKLKSAKELMDRKKEGLQGSYRLGSRKHMKEKVGETDISIIEPFRVKDEKLKGGIDGDGGGAEIALREEKKTVSKTELPGVNHGEALLRPHEKHVEENKRESRLSSRSNKAEETSEWKEATEFFDLITVDEPKKDFGKTNCSETLVQNEEIHEYKHKGKRVMPSFEPQSGNDMKLKMGKEDGVKEFGERRKAENFRHKEHNVKSKDASEMKVRGKKSQPSNEVCDEVEKKGFPAVTQLSAPNNRIPETGKSVPGKETHLQPIPIACDNKSSKTLTEQIRSRVAAETLNNEVLLGVGGTENEVRDKIFEASATVNRGFMDDALVPFECSVKETRGDVEGKTNTTDDSGVFEIENLLFGESLKALGKLQENSSGKELSHLNNEVKDTTEDDEKQVESHSANGSDSPKQARYSSSECEEKKEEYIQVQVLLDQEEQGSDSANVCKGREVPLQHEDSESTKPTQAMKESGENIEKVEAAQPIMTEENQCPVQQVDASKAAEIKEEEHRVVDAERDVSSRALESHILKIVAEEQERERDSEGEVKPNNLNSVQQVLASQTTEMAEKKREEVDSEREKSKLESKRIRTVEEEMEMQRDIEIEEKPKIQKTDQQVNTSEVKEMKEKTCDEVDAEREKRERELENNRLRKVEEEQERRDMESEEKRKNQKSVQQLDASQVNEMKLETYEVVAPEREERERGLENQGLKKVEEEQKGDIESEGKLKNRSSVQEMNASQTNEMKQKSYEEVDSEREKIERELESQRLRAVEEDRDRERNTKREREVKPKSQKSTLVSQIIEITEVFDEVGTEQEKQESEPEKQRLRKMEEERERERSKEREGEVKPKNQISTEQVKASQTTEKKEKTSGELETGRIQRERELENERLRCSDEERKREEKLKNQKSTQQANTSKNIDRKEKTSGEVENERMRRERDMETERLRKIEEEREREREREKDRMAVDLATLEARERASGESRERAERIAVERATTEARQRAMTVARERLEKACAEAREKSLAGKTSTDARLRAERAAVERATAEARERAAERAASEAKDRVQRSVSDKFTASARNNGMRQSSSSSDLQDSQNQNSKAPKYQYSSVHGEGNNGGGADSAQRCKAIFERNRRTSERAANALAEKNMRDLQTQKEQAERNRLAETLDADVKRWSSGKEGNLRALLSTLQYILGPEGGWQPIPLTEVITSAAVKKAYRKATLCVHPDKLQQRGASIHQKYICEKVFDLLKEAWSKFNSEER